MEQLMFETDDFNAKDILNDIAIECFSEKQFDISKIKIRPTKPKGVVTGFSLSFGGELILKINIKFSELSFNKAYSFTITNYLKSKELTNPQNFIKYTFEVYSEDIKQYAKKAILEYIRTYSPPERFGCCHLYVQCSDEKRCIALYQDYAKGCQYRQNLEQGRIFYGKNANA